MNKICFEDEGRVQFGVRIINDVYTKNSLSLHTQTSICKVLFCSENVFTSFFHQTMCKHLFLYGNPGMKVTGSK